MMPTVVSVFGGRVVKNKTIKKKAKAIYLYVTGTKWWNI